MMLFYINSTARTNFPFFSSVFLKLYCFFRLYIKVKFIKPKDFGVNKIVKIMWSICARINGINEGIVEKYTS